MNYSNRDDFLPGMIGRDFTGPEVFELVRMAIDEKINEAQDEVDRLIRRIQYHAENMRQSTHPNYRPDMGVPAMHNWQATQDMVALQAARAQVAALNAAWFVMMHAVAGPSICEDTQDAVDARRAEFYLGARKKLERS